MRIKKRNKLIYKFYESHDFDKHEKFTQERTNEVKNSNMKLREEIVERKRTEELLRIQHEQLEEQLSFSNALNLIAETIIKNDDTQKILQTMAEIVGSTLNADRSLIYYADYSKHLIRGLCEWLNPNTLYITATKDTFNLDIFIDSITYMKNHHQWLESHIDDYSSYLSHDGSGEILHKDMQIKSLLWYPFYFHKQGYYGLTFNQVDHRRIWRKEEIEFIDKVARLVEIAIQKINFISEQKRNEKALLRQHKQLQEQYSFSNALNQTAKTIISNENTDNILEIMVETIGSTLGLDRTFIYDVDFVKHQAICHCAWYNPKILNVPPSKNTYSLDLFVDGYTYMKNYRLWIESHMDHYSPYVLRDGSGDLLHKEMQIKSGFWYPFSFREQGYYCLTFNQISHRRIWCKEELDFIASVANLVEIAIQKIDLLTEQKRHEEALRQSEERFYKLFHHSPVSLTLFSLDSGKYIDANECCLKMHGYSKKEFIGNTPTNLNLWVNKVERSRYHKDLVEKGFAYNHEIKVNNKSGEVFEVLLSGIMIDINGEKCVLGTKTDITELRQYQREISRLDRFNLIGKIASGIAHEIRNPMTTVKGFLQLLNGKQEFELHKNILTLMVSELDRANSIITEFLSLVKNKPIDLKPLDLNSIIENLFPLIQSDGLVADKYVDLELNNIANLLGDGNELRQLILNLVRNGFEAMSPGGKLTIKTYMKFDKIVLVIQDQGKGMEVDIINKIGTPFFTTKDNGTGLGLATCYSIADRHNASINFDTRPTGTTFYVSFKTLGFV